MILTGSPVGKVGYADIKAPFFVWKLCYNNLEKVENPIAKSSFAAGQNDQKSMNKILLWIAIAVVLAAIATFLFLGKSPSLVGAPTSSTDTSISGDPDMIIASLLVEDPQSPAEADPTFFASDENTLNEFDLNPNQF